MALYKKTSKTPPYQNRFTEFCGIILFILYVLLIPTVVSENLIFMKFMDFAIWFLRP